MQLPSPRIEIWIGMIETIPQLPNREELVAEYNQEHGRKLTWSEAAKKSAFKRIIRYRFNRADLYYRQHFVSQ